MPSESSKLPGSQNSLRATVGMFRARLRQLVYIGRVCRRNCGSWEFGGLDASRWRMKLEGNRECSRLCPGGGREFSLWNGQSFGRICRANDARADREAAFGSDSSRQDRFIKCKTKRRII